MLDGIGVPAGDRCFLQLADVEDLWARYLPMLREGVEYRSRWPADQRVDVQQRIDAIAGVVDGLRAVWLVLSESEPIGVEVPAAALLRAGTGHVVSPAADLMLTTRDISHGICIELNQVPSGEEYEIAAWGDFRP